MTENMKKFLELLSENSELAAKVNEKKDEEAFIAVANEAGIPLTKEDLKQQAQELSDDELDAVAGGGNKDAKICACMVGGGGDPDDIGKTCACVAYGQGDLRDGRIRCLCAFAGTGQHPDCMGGGYA